MTFSGVITNDQSEIHAKGQRQRSKVKVTDVNTQINSFRTVTRRIWPKLGGSGLFEFTNGYEMIHKA